MKIAGLQTDIIWENPEDNFKHVEQLLVQAAEQGATIAVLPEMFATGFTMDSKKAASFSNITRRFLADVSSKLSIWVIGGLVEDRKMRKTRG